VTNTYSTAGHWDGAYEPEKLRAWAEELRAKLSSPVTLGLVFMGPRFFQHAAAALELLRFHAQIPLLAGCSSQGIIANGEELEQSAGISLGLYSLPDAQLKGFHFTQEQVEQAGEKSYWQERTGIEQGKTNAWLVFADPFHLDSEAWLTSWNASYKSLPVLGGLASGDFREQRTQIYLDEQVFETGGVAISFAGKATVVGVTSQGCTPIGDTWTLTKVERNIIHEIGNQRAYDVLAQTYAALSPEEQVRARGNLFIGLVVDEYLEEFHRGDFLIRNLLGADPKTGSIAVGAFPRAGQTVQFQRRSASAATEDLAELLTRAKTQLKSHTIYGGCLCSCNGRGVGLFGRPNHDASMVQERIGPIGLAGFFCNGEIGPVGEKNFLHGYTASLALFVKK
jgi:small ligand-binding sensory domain FIST